MSGSDSAQSFVPPPPPLRTQWPAPSPVIRAIPAPTIREVEEIKVIPLDPDELSDADRTLERPTLIAELASKLTTEDDPTLERVTMVDPDASAFPLKVRVLPLEDATPASEPVFHAPASDTLKPIARSELAPAPVSTSSRTRSTRAAFGVLAAAVAFAAVGAALLSAGSPVARIDVASAAPKVAAKPHTKAAPIRVAPPPVTSATTVAKPVTPRPNVPPGFTLLTFQDNVEKGHRVWVDGFLSTWTPVPIPVRCGIAHNVRVGSAGKTQAIQATCGTDIVVGMQSQ